MNNYAFNYHPLSKITVKEKLLFGWSWSQSFWLLGGGFVSMKMADLVPPLTFLPMPYKYFHWFIPLIISVLFAFISHNSGMSYIQYWSSYISYRLRKRTYINRNFK